MNGLQIFGFVLLFVWAIVVSVVINLAVIWFYSKADKAWDRFEATVRHRKK